MSDPRPGSTSSMHPLARRVATRLRDRCGLQDGARLLLGVSGGADSVALLHLLVEVAPAHQLRLEIAHFDHALRAGSEDDAAFVRELAAQHGLPLHAERWQQPRPGEDAARRARFAFLAATAARAACDGIVLGHHLDDQIETVLLRLTRGAGLRGWRSMAWRRPGRVPILRPLLDVRRDRLNEYLQQRGQAWREDPTNRNLGPARNRIRALAMPALDAALDVGWAARWSASLDELRDLWGWMQDGACKLLAQCNCQEDLERGIHSCAREPLRTAPEPLLRVALQLWIGGLQPRDVSRKHLTAASMLVRNGQSGHGLDLPGGLQLVLEQGNIVLIQRQQRGPREPGAPVPTAAPLWILHVEALAGVEAWAEIVAAHAARSATAAATPSTAPPVPSRRASPSDCGLDSLPSTAEVLVGTELMELPLTVRTLQPGDRVQLLGAPGSKSVSRILQARRVPRRLRARWPLVVDARGVVWVPAVGVAERARLHAEAAHALRMRLAPVDPPRPATLAAPEPAV